MKDNKFFISVQSPKKLYRMIWMVIKITILIMILLFRFKLFSVERHYEREWNIDFADCVGLVEDHENNVLGNNGYRYTVFDVKRTMKRLQVYQVYHNELDYVCKEVINVFADEVSNKPDFGSELNFLSMTKGNDELIVLYSHSEHRLYCFVHPL